MSAREFAKWRALFVHRPFDDEGAFHLPVAHLSSLTANMNRKTGSAAYKPSQFLPFFEDPEVDIDSLLLSNDW